MTRWEIRRHEENKIYLRFQGRRIPFARMWLEQLVFEQLEASHIARDVTEKDISASEQLKLGGYPSWII